MMWKTVVLRVLMLNAIAVRSSAAAEPPMPDIGDSFSKEAPAGEHAPDDPHAIAGVWTLRQPGHPSPYEVKAEYRGKVAAYSPPPPPGSRADNADPAQLCTPTAFFDGGTYPTQIIQTPGRITLINEENHRIRRIYLDQKHPVGLRPSYSGHSIGHWDGETLVVETVAIRPRPGRTFPPGYRVLERFRKLEGGRELEQNIVYDSPAYSKPSTETVTYNWRPDLHLQEEICEEFSDPYGNSYFGQPEKK